MGQTRQKQLDRIVKKYPNKSAAQIAKDHKIPYSTVWNYMKRKQIPKVEVDVPKPEVNHKPVKHGFSEAQLVWNMVISFTVGAAFVLLMEYI
jgi:hypothetical protein